MKHFPTCLWKEWREQRAALAILAGLLAAGTVPVAAVLEAPQHRDPLVSAAVVAAAVAATLVSIGSDLLARERQRGTLAFLERAPAGLGGAFRAKLVFLALALLFAVAWGALLASAVSLTGTGELPELALGDGAALLAAMALVLSLWVFAVSAWTPSGATALPTTLLLLPVLGWPVALVLRDVPWLRPTAREGTVFLALAGVGALGSAWASFVVGSRRGGTRRKAAAAGLAVAALAFLPSWVWVGARWYVARNAPFLVHHGWIAPDGRHAYLNLIRSASASESTYDYARTTALVVNLERGTWRVAGAVDGSAFAEELALARRRSLLGVGPPDRLQLHDESTDEVAIVELGGTSTAPAEIELAPSDFGLETEPPAYDVRWAGLGQALRFRRGDDWAEIYRDPVRGILVDRAALLPGEEATSATHVRVRPGHWLARPHGRWHLLDPETGAAQAVPGLSVHERIGPSITDGRVLVLGAGAPALLEPESGARTPLAVLGTDPADVLLVRHGRGVWEPPISADTPTVVLVSAPRWSAPAVLDVRAGTLRCAPHTEGRRGHLIGVTDLVAVAVEDGLELVRYDLASDVREVLFSVDSVEP